MKKNTLYIVGGVAVLVAAAFFIFRKKSDKDKNGEPQEPIKNLDDNIVESTKITVGPTTADSLGGTSKSVFGFLSEYNDYQVVTQSSALNVRQKPDGISKVVGSLPKGSKIKGKASGVKGWFDVSKDGTTNYGYVSAQFLKALPKK